MLPHPDSQMPHVAPERPEDENLDDALGLRLAQRAHGGGLVLAEPGVGTGHGRDHPVGGFGPGAGQERGGGAGGRRHPPTVGTGSDRPWPPSTVACQPKKTSASAYSSGVTSLSSPVPSTSGTRTMSVPRSAIIVP